jgi:hypothetical protein
MSNGESIKFKNKEVGKGVLEGVILDQDHWHTGRRNVWAGEMLKIVYHGGIKRCKLHCAKRTGAYMSMKID